MIKNRLRHLFVVLLIVVFTLSGCGSWLRLNEEEIYTEKVELFLDALDKGNAEEIKALFSKTVVDSDTDLDEQIDKLISIYPRSESEAVFEGGVAGEYKDDSGKHSSAVYSTLPIVCDGNDYWLYFYLVYEDDFEPDNIGFRQLYFYTADEYGSAYHDDGATTPEEDGLLVFSDLKLENEVRCINTYPYEYTPVERDMKESEVKSFIESNKNMRDFNSRFGKPNAMDGLGTYYYEFTDTDGSTVYFEVATQDNNILWINVVNEHKFIRSVYDQVEP